MPEKQSVIKLKRDFNLCALLKGLNNVEQTDIFLIFRNKFVTQLRSQPGKKHVKVVGIYFV